MASPSSCGPHTELSSSETVRVTRCSCGTVHVTLLRSGVTVLTADRPFTAAVHVMGGAPGTRETDLLAPDKLVESVDALVLSGGSAFGLDAASGVMAGLHAMGRGFAVGPAQIERRDVLAFVFDLEHLELDVGVALAFERRGFGRCHRNVARDVDAAGRPPRSVVRRADGGREGAAAAVVVSTILVLAIVGVFTEKLG